MIDRLGLAPLAHEQLGHVAVQALRIERPVRGRLRRHAERELEHADDLRGVPLRRVIPAQLGERARRTSGALLGATKARSSSCVVAAAVFGSASSPWPRRAPPPDCRGDRASTPRSARAASAPPPRRDPEPRPLQRHQLPVAPLALQQSLERGDDRRVPGPQLGQRAEVLDGAIGAPREIPRDLRRLAEQIHPVPGVLRRRDPEIVLREELVPPPLDRQQHRQPPEGPGRQRIERKRAEQHRDDHGPVLRPLGEERRRALAELERELARQRLSDHVGVDRRHVIGPLLFGGDALRVVP